MKRTTDHLWLGGVSGFLAEVLLAYLNEEELTLEKIFAAVFGGVIGAGMPDWIEPAVNPHHRSFMHSVTGGGFSVSFLQKLLKNKEIHPLIRSFLRSALVGYLSHLVTDAFSPKSLPLIC